MRIGEITVDSYGFEVIDFYGSRSFLDYDVIIIDFDKIIFELYGKSFNIKQSRHKPIEVINDPKHRINDFDKYLENGRKLVIITPFNYTIDYDGSYRYQLNEIFNFLQFYTIENRAGKSVNITHKKLKDIGLENKISYTFDAYFDLDIEKPFATIKDTNYVVSFMPDEQTLFIPRIKAELNGNYTNFFNDIINSFFIDEIEKEAIPDWAFDFYNKDEAILITEYNELKIEKEKIEEIIEVKTGEIEKQYELKRLFTATGVELENIVENVFLNMGFEMLPSAANRHDLILKYKEQIVVIEIKGVTGSASEKNSTQLEKWVSIYHADKDFLPKGILVVNAFNSLPINKRIEHVFPNQMLQFAKSKNHCLISGLQLYGFYLAYLESNEKDKLIDELIQTIGVYGKFDNYKEFLNFKEKE